MKNSSPFDNRHQLDDEALLEMLRLDYEWALKEIFSRYHLRLFRLAFGVLQDEDLAKDLVQDLFIDLWYRRQNSNIKELSHYLTRAIKFQVLKQLRNGKLREYHLKMIQNVKFANETEESLNFQELESSLQKALDELPLRCKEVFVLSRFENLSHKEIAARLNISTKTVEVQITKALAQLRIKLQGILMLIFLLS